MAPNNGNFGEVKRVNDLAAILKGAEVIHESSWIQLKALGEDGVPYVALEANTRGASKKLISDLESLPDKLKKDQSALNQFLSYHKRGFYLRS